MYNAKNIVTPFLLFMLLIAFATLASLFLLPIVATEDPRCISFVHELIQNTYAKENVKEVGSGRIPQAIEQLQLHQNNGLNTLFIQAITLDILDKLPFLSLDDLLVSCQKNGPFNSFCLSQNGSTIHIALYTEKALLPSYMELVAICSKESGYLLFPSALTDSSWEEKLLRMLLNKNSRIKAYTLPLEGFSYSIVTWRNSSYPLSPGPPSTHNVTYQLSGGRLGDNLLSYLHALWISYKYNMNLIVQPFPLIEFFELSSKRKKRKGPIFDQQLLLTKEEHIAKEDKAATLYTVPYFPENKEMTGAESTYPLFHVQWEDEGFKALMQRSLAVRIPTFKAIIDCSDALSVGIHVRRGDGFDTKETQKNVPLKFPPLSYYAQAITKLIDLMPYTPMEFFLFTDAQSPGSLKEELKSLVNRPITLHHRESSIYDPWSQIQDFLDLQHCDALIIAQSNFSLVASKVSDPWLVITPIDCIQEEDNNLITATLLSVNGTKKKALPITIPPRR